MLKLKMLLVVCASLLVTAAYADEAVDNEGQVATRAVQLKPLGGAPKLVRVAGGTLNKS